LIGQILLHYLGEPNIITRILINGRRRQESESQRRDVTIEKDGMM